MNAEKIEKKYGKFFIPVLLFFLAFLARFVFSYFVAGLGNALASDSSCYLIYAQNLIKEGVYRDHNSYAFRPPGYPFFCAGVFYLFSNTITALKMAQITLSSFVPVMIFFAGRRVLSFNVAFWAAFFSCFYFGFIIEASHILSEVVFTPLFFASAFVLLKPAKNKSFFISGVLAGLSALVRPLGLLLPPFYALWLFLAGFKKNYKPFLLIVLGFSLAMSFWWIRNYSVFKKFIPVALETGFVFQHAYSPEDKLDRIFENDIYPEIERDKRNFDKGFNYMKDMPLKSLLKKWLVNFFQFFYPFMPEYDFTYALIAPFFILGFFCVFKNRDWAMIPMTAFLIYLPISAVFFSAARYRHSMGPFFIILAAYFIDRKKELLKSFSVKVSLSLWFVFNFFVLFNFEAVRFFIKRFLGFLL